MSNNIPNKIYVGNLPFETTEQNLEDTFRPADGIGEIKEVVLIKDRFSGKSKGFGFVTFTTEAAAQAAIQLNGKELGGRQMKINLAREPEKREGGGRGGFGGGGSGGRGGFGGGNRRERDRW